MHAVCILPGRLEHGVEGTGGLQPAQCSSLSSSICGKLRWRQHCLPLTWSSVSPAPWDVLPLKRAGRQSLGVTVDVVAGAATAVMSERPSPEFRLEILRERPQRILHVLHC